MTTVNIEEAQADLTRLIDQALAGKPFLITREGTPVVRVCALETAADALPPRRLGLLEGRYKVPADIKGPWKDEIEEMFGLKD